MFKRKEQPTTIRAILGKDEVKQVVQEFITQHLPSAEGVIIVWATKGDLCIVTGGLSEAEVIGSLGITGHRIQHEGIPE